MQGNTRKWFNHVDVLALCFSDQFSRTVETLLQAPTNTFVRNPAVQEFLGESLIVLPRPVDPKFLYGQLVQNDVQTIYMVLVWMGRNHCVD